MITESKQSLCLCSQSDLNQRVSLVTQETLKLCLEDSLCGLFLGTLTQSRVSSATFLSAHIQSRGSLQVEARLQMTNHRQGEGIEIYH